MTHELSNDPHALSRFVSAQEKTFNTALTELKRGKKESHWMWFIFPQIEGLGHSSMTQRYAIKSPEEARAYLEHLILGPRLLECCNALLAVKGKSAANIMGSPDDLKLSSSMTLFSRVAADKSVFERVLEFYDDGKTDQKTLALLNR